jgi:hypothetical protein
MIKHTDLTVGDLIQVGVSIGHSVGQWPQIFYVTKVTSHCTPYPDEFLLEGLSPNGFRYSALVSSLFDENVNMQGCVSPENVTLITKESVVLA